VSSEPSPAALLDQPVATAGHGRGWLLLPSTADTHSNVRIRRRRLIVDGAQ